MITKAMKTNLLRLIMTAFLFLMINDAWAVCNWTGKVVRLRTGAAGNIVDIAGLTAFPNTFAFFVVPNDRYYSILGDAAAGHLTVNVRGNAASCVQTTPPFFDGGTLTSVDMNVNR